MNEWPIIRTGSPMSSMLKLMVASILSTEMYGETKFGEKDDDLLLEEYKKIKNKKSTLSRKEREDVVYYVENTLKKKAENRENWVGE